MILMLIIQLKKIRRLDEFAFSFNLTQIICKPTRVTETSKSTINLILVNNTQKIVQCDVLDSSISDHNVIFCVVKGGVKKLPPKVFEYRSFKSYEKKAFIKDHKCNSLIVVGTVVSVACF